MKNEDLDYLGKALYEVNKPGKEVRRALVKKGIEAIPILIQAVKDKNTVVQWRAFNVLSRIGSFGTPILTDVLYEGDTETIARVLHATEWELTRADTPDLQSVDAQGKSILPSLIRLLDHNNKDVQFWARGIIEKVGLPSAHYLAEHLINDCKSEQCELNCLLSLRGILSGRGVEYAESAISTYQPYVSHLFLRATSKRNTRNGWHYCNLLIDMGIASIPVLAQAWMNGTQHERESANVIMDKDLLMRGFVDGVPCSYKLMGNPRGYCGPTSPADDIFNQANPDSFSDVEKIVSALQYKYLDTVDQNRDRTLELYRLAKKSDPSGEKLTPESEELRKHMMRTGQSVDLVRKRAIEYIRENSTLILPQVLEIAQYADDDRRLCALDALALMKGIDDNVIQRNPTIAPVVIRFIRTPHTWYREMAILAVANMGQPLLPVLASYASNGDQLNRLASIAGMASVSSTAPRKLVALVLESLEPFTLADDNSIKAFATWCKRYCRHTPTS